MSTGVEPPLAIDGFARYQSIHGEEHTIHQSNVLRISGSKAICTRRHLLGQHSVERMRTMLAQPHIILIYRAATLATFLGKACSNDCETPCLPIVFPRLRKHGLSTRLKRVRLAKLIPALFLRSCLLPPSNRNLVSLTSPVQLARRGSESRNMLGCAISTYGYRGHLLASAYSGKRQNSCPAMVCAMGHARRVFTTTTRIPSFFDSSPPMLSFCVACLSLTLSQDAVLPNNGAGDSCVDSICSTRGT